MKRVLMPVAIAALILTGCGKKDAKKTEAGSEEAKKSAEAVKPAAEEGEKSKEGNLQVENLKVKALPNDKKDTAGNTPKEKRISGPVAVVNGTPVNSEQYYSEVDKILQRSSKLPPERMNRIKENILKRLIENQLIAQAVSNAGVTIPDTEIDTDFEAYKKRFRTEEQFQNYLKHGRVTIDSIKSRLREKKEQEKLLEKNG